MLERAEKQVRARIIEFENKPKSLLSKHQKISLSTDTSDAPVLSQHPWKWWLGSEWQVQLPTTSSFLPFWFHKTTCPGGYGDRGCPLLLFYLPGLLRECLASRSYFIYRILAARKCECCHFYFLALGRHMER